MVEIGWTIGLWGLLLSRDKLLARRLLTFSLLGQELPVGLVLLVEHAVVVHELEVLQEEGLGHLHSLFALVHHSVEQVCLVVWDQQ